MFKELLSILDDTYPFLNESESLLTITYSILFWLLIGVSSCTIVLLFPFLFVFGSIFFIFYKVRYREFPDYEELEDLENEIINGKKMNIDYSHYTDDLEFYVNKELYKTKLHSIYIKCKNKKMDTLVILHGMNSSATLISSIYGYLSQCFDIYAIDIPGFGRSNIVNRDGSLLYHQLGIIYYNKVIENYLRIKDVRDAILIGHSFGGFIAGNYCIHTKTGIKQVILIEPAGLLPFFSKYGAPLAVVFKNSRVPTYLGNFGVMCSELFTSYSKNKLGNHYNYIIGHYPNNDWGKKIISDFITLNISGGHWNHPIISNFIRIAIPFTVIYGEDDFIIGDHKKLINILFPDSSCDLKCGHSPFLNSAKETSKEIIRSIHRMKNRRKHTKHKIKGIQNDIFINKYLSCFKSTFDLEHSQRIQELFYKKYYLL